MRTLTILTACALISVSVACSSSETVDEDTAPAETPEEFDDAPEEEEPEAEDDDEVAEEDDLDLSELIDQQIAACNELVCDRPFECYDELGDDDADPGFTSEECSEIYCEINREALEAMDHTESLQHCLEVDAELGECLDGLACDEFLTYVDQDTEDSGSCADEIAAQEDACATYWAKAEELRIQRMSE